MKRPSLSTTRRPVVLLVQACRDDSLEVYAEFLRYHGLAVIPVADARDALMLAPQVDIVVTGIILDDRMDGVELALAPRRLSEVHAHRRTDRVCVAERPAAC